MTAFTLSCVLFDLDGTLVDTAPDLIACVNNALQIHGYPAAEPAALKPFISFGAAAMIKESQAQALPDARQADVLATMLDLYQDNIAEYSRFFPGIADALATIEALGLKWGVVTNKRERFTQPLMDALNLTARAACIVSGDTTSHAKPHPEPMLAACRQAGVSPDACVYIGDARHDVVAGKNAGMKTLVAAYGYLQPDDTPETWGADALAASPAHLLTWIDSVLCR